MQILLISYSLTGNNQALAEACAAKLGANHFILEEERERKITTTLLDMAFGRKPRLKALPPSASAYNLVIFMGPIWMFNIASPFRRCFKALRKDLKKYAFVSLSGGALGANVGLPRELARRLGKKNLALVLDVNAYHFCRPAIEVNQKADLGGNQAPDTSDKGEYRLAAHPEDLQRLTNMICGILGEIQA
ncbi:MAG: hypothetical protein KKI09_15420 [Spirochaetes bacterium]|nr:hypothetical protein [Spirochaetota bacterium]MBU0956810.1 hypothetical protein [Spirochaetota bacterium]